MKLSFRRRGFTLLELIFMLTAAALVLLVIDKLFLDGLYLQRVAAERENRAAIVTSLVERLRTDALGATAYSWKLEGDGGTLVLTTPGTETAPTIEWIFRNDEIRRRANGCDAGAFAAERLSFEAALEPGDRADLLVLELIVAPPEQSHLTKPQTSAVRVLLPERTQTVDQREGVVSL